MPNSMIIIAWIKIQMLKLKLSLNFGTVWHYSHFRTSFSQSSRDYPAVAILPFFLFIVPDNFGSSIRQFMDAGSGPA
jgi:hypothetical protein